MRAEPLSEVAANLQRIIRAHPGIHFRGLERAAGLTSPGQLRHHLDQLQKRGLVVEIQDGGFHRFFLAGEHDRNLRRRMARLSRPVPKRIAGLLLQSRMDRTSLRRALGCADSTLGYYLSRMEQAGDLVKSNERARAYYALADPESVREVLEAQQASRTFHEAPQDRLPGTLAAEEVEVKPSEPTQDRAHPLATWDPAGREAPEAEAVAVVSGWR